MNAAYWTAIALMVITTLIVIAKPRSNDWASGIGLVIAVCMNSFITWLLVVAVMAR